MHCAAQWEPEAADATGAAGTAPHPEASAAQDSSAAPTPSTIHHDSFIKPQASDSFAHPEAAHHDVAGGAAQQAQRAQQEGGEGLEGSIAILAADPVFREVRRELGCISFRGIVVVKIACSKGSAETWLCTETSTPAHCPTHPILPARTHAHHPSIQVLGFWSYYRSVCGYDADAMQEWVSQVRRVVGGCGWVSVEQLHFERCRSGSARCGELWVGVGECVFTLYFERCRSGSAR